MVLDEVQVLGDVLIKNLGSCARLAIFHAVPVARAPSLICRLLADGVLCHLEGVPHRDTIGKEVAACALGYIAQGIVGRAIVKARVVRDNRLDIVLLAQVSHMAASGEDGDDAAAALGNLALVHRALLGVVGGIEQRAISAKDVINDEGEGLIDVAALVVDGAAQVVHHGIIKAICGLRVNGQIVRFALVNHW